MFRRIAILAVITAFLPFAVAAQQAPGSASDAPNENAGGHFNQVALKMLQDNQVGDIDSLFIPQVFYDYYVVKGENGLRGRLRLYRDLGLSDRSVDAEMGQALIEILNRRLLESIQPGDTLVVPTEFGLDLRAYSPFPRFYPGGKTYDKLVILHKEIQAFAAYEYGKLVRWGIINTGIESSSTPEGRFNVNWREEERVSSLSPPDDPWLMTWVMNIWNERGIHMHQYAMPTGGPASHGCIRLNDADAYWMYNWVDTWEKSGGSDRVSGGRIQRQGTTVLVLGPDPEVRPRTYVYKERYPILRIMELPADPMEVPPGSPQQRQFDRLRAQAR